MKSPSFCSTLSWLATHLLPARRPNWPFCSWSVDLSTFEIPSNLLNQDFVSHCRYSYLWNRFFTGLCHCWRGVTIWKLQWKVTKIKDKYIFKTSFYFNVIEVRDNFKTQLPVDRRFRPVPAGFYCSKQRQPPGTVRNHRSTGGWVLKSPLII